MSYQPSTEAERRAAETERNRQRFLRYDARTRAELRASLRRIETGVATATDANRLRRALGL